MGQQIRYRRSDIQTATDAIYNHMWRSMLKERKLSWFDDTSRGTALKVLNLTVQRLRERRTREEDWRMFLSPRTT